MARLIVMVYFMWVGWLIRKSKLDEKAVAWARERFRELAREAAQIAIEEQRRDQPPPALEA